MEDISATAIHKDGNIHNVKVTWRRPNYIPDYYIVNITTDGAEYNEIRQRSHNISGVRWLHLQTCYWREQLIVCFPSFPVDNLRYRIRGYGTLSGVQRVRKGLFISWGRTWGIETLWITPKNHRLASRYESPSSQWTDQTILPNILWHLVPGSSSDTIIIVAVVACVSFVMVIVVCAYLLRRRQRRRQKNLKVSSVNMTRESYSIKWRVNHLLIRVYHNNLILFAERIQPRQYRRWNYRGAKIWNEIIPAHAQLIVQVFLAVKLNDRR